VKETIEQTLCPKCGTHCWGWTHELAIVAVIHCYCLNGILDSTNNTSLVKQRIAKAAAHGNASADFGRYVNQVPSSTADIVCALHLHVPALEAGFVLVPVGAGADPNDFLYIFLAVVVQILSHQADSPRVHKKPRGSRGGERLKEACSMHDAVFSRRDVFVWTGCHLDADNVYGARRCEEVGFEEAEAAADRECECRRWRQQRGKIVHERRAEGETAPCVGRGLVGERGEGWPWVCIVVLTRSCHKCVLVHVHRPSLRVSSGTRPP
jgi:hypothetical protein